MHKSDKDTLIIKIKEEIENVIKNYKYVYNTSIIRESIKNHIEEILNKYIIYDNKKLISNIAIEVSSDKNNITIDISCEYGNENIIKRNI